MSENDFHSFLPETYVDGFHDKEYVTKMRYKKFGNTSMNFSVLSMGCAGLAPGTNADSVEETQSIMAVETAIRKGINFIDVAPWYGFGKSEEVLGKALLGVPRKSYYIATKVGRYLPDYEYMFDFSAEKTFESVNTSLKKLNIDYIDIIQVHDIEFAPSLDIIINETLPVLQKFKEEGKVRYIGITANPPKILKELYDRCSIHIDSVLSHCHCMLVNTDFNDYIDYYQSEGVGTINAALLAMGLLTDKGPMKWHRAHDDIKDACRKAAEYCWEEGVNISKIATHYAIETFKGTTNLIGFAEIDLLNKNLDVLHNKITEKEQIVMDSVIDKFMKPLKVTDWSERELSIYTEKYAAAILKRESALKSN